MTKSATRKTKVPASKLRELAVAAQADPRSVAKVLAGGELKGGALSERIAKVLKAAGLLLALLLLARCDGTPIAWDSDGDDLSGLPSVPVTWPLTGGLDTSTSPLVQQPGSFLQLDDVTQERAGEWRNRYGFTQAAADTLANGIAPLVGKLGDAGMFELNETLATYQPSLTSNRWTTPSAGVFASEDITRVPTVTTDNTKIGFAQAGNLYIVASLDSVAPSVAVFDAQGKTHAKVALTTGLYIRARCAATAGKLVAYLASTAGNLDTIVVDVATGVVTGPTTIKAGCHATQPYLDAMWYGGTTITVVVRLAAADAVRFMEHNPATGALATDVSLAGIAASSCISLSQDFSASGVRFVGTSDVTANQTRMLLVTSAGAITTNDIIDLGFGAATQITAVGYSAGTRYDALFQDTATGRVIRAFRNAGGAGATSALISHTGNTATTIDGQAWSFDGVNYQFLLGMHSTDTGDPQDSWVMMSLALNGGVNVYEQSRIAPLQASARFIAGTDNASLFQQVGVAAHLSKFALPVLARYSLENGVAIRQYSIDVFSRQVTGTADIATVINRGPAVPYKQTSFIPGNSAAFLDEGLMIPIGMSAPPPKPILNSQGAGALTAQTTYQYVQYIETVDSDGNVWRSPPSQPLSVTMAANTANNITMPQWATQRFGQRYRAILLRVSANGFVFRRITSFQGAFGVTSFTFNDTLADTAIATGDVLYTTGETPTAITPRASHVMTAKDRLWLVNADFRTELWASKNLRPGRQPEFTNTNVNDIDDNYGDITGLSTIDDNLVVFKRNAVYFVNGDGLADDGSGTNFGIVMVSGDVGAIPGSPIVQAGDAIYFVSDRGIMSIDRGGNVQPVGRDVDRFINQPLIQTPERIWDGVYVPSKNEVRFVTDNYVLVHNRKFATTATIAANSTGSYWSRWNFAGGRRTLLINNQQVIIKSDGTVWREGDQTQLTDQGAAIAGVIRSSWIRPQGLEGFLRLRRARLLGTRTAGGGNITPTMNVFFDNIDSASEGPFAPQAAIAAGTTPVVAEAMPRQHRCSAFSLQVNLPSGDNTFRLNGWSVLIAAKPGTQKNVGTAGRWQ